MTKKKFELANEKIVEQNGSNAQGQAVMEVFLKALRKKRLKYNYAAELENRICFKKQRMSFVADVDCEDNFVIIYMLHNILIDLKDEKSLSMLRKAINATNGLCNVTTYYDKDDEVGVTIVLTKSIIHFVVDNPNFKMELGIALETCLGAQHLLRELLKRIKKDAKERKE